MLPPTAEPERRRGAGALLLRFCRSGTALCGRSVRILLRVLVFLYFVFAVLVLMLRYAVLPNIGRYQPEVEQLLSRSLGREARVAQLRASWSGLNPQLLLKDVTIRDQRGATALSLPEISATLSWWTLVSADLRFEQIELRQPVLDMRREPDGKLFIAGFYLDPHQPSDGRGLDWLLRQHRLVIRDGAVRWNDLLRQAAPLELSGVNLLWRNEWRHHRFAVQAQPSANLAAPLDVRGDFQHPVFAKRISEFGNWSGELYAGLRAADLPALQAYVDAPIALQRGYGTLRSWVRFEQGRIADLTADVSLSDVTGKLGKDVPPLDMAQVGGRIVASEHASFGHKYLPSLFGRVGHSIALIDFSMQTRDGVRLPAATIRENFIPAQKNQPERVELYAKALDLGMLAGVVAHLPLPPGQRQMLADFSPQGQLKEFNAKWQGTYPDIASYSVKGQFLNLSLRPQPAQLARPKSAHAPARAALPAIPGFQNLSGSIDANDKGGSFDLDSSGLVLQLPGYFVDPDMPFDRLQMQARWQFEPQDRFSFVVSQMEAQQDGMRASVTGRHILSLRGDGQPGEVDISGKVSGFDLKQLDRFIPVATPGDLRHWLTKSIQAGRADDVSLRLRGDLKHFPFATGEARAAGDFSVKGNLSGGKLDFTAGELAEDGKSPLWPVIDQIDGGFAFERARMEIRGDHAKSNGLDLHKVKAIIPDLGSPNAQLQIDGQVAGALQTMLGYVNASPVAGWLDHFLQDSKANANAGLSLKLLLPLAHLADAKVNGVLQFANNEVVLLPGLPPVAAVNGKLEFNERGVNLGTLKGNALGGALTVSGGTQKDGSVRVRLEGSASGEGMRKVLPPAVAEQFADKLVGTTRYTAGIAVRKGQSELIVESALQGLALNFPAPLRKAAADKLPLRFEILPLPAGEGASAREEVRLALGSAVNAKYLRYKPRERNAPWQVLRGGIAVNMPVPEPERGLSLSGDFKSLDMDEWRRLLARLPATAAPVGAGSLGMADIAPYIEPDTLAVHTNELRILGKTIDNVVLGASRQKALWQANIDSNQASGHLSWSAGGDGAGSIAAHLSNLVIPQSAAADVSDLLEGKTTQTQMPGLDITAENFELFGKKLGQLDLQASNQATLSGREWQIARLSLKNADAELKSSGQWSSRGKDGGTRLNFTLEVANSGKLLERLGFANIVRGGRGKLDGEINWNGLPFALDLPSLGGQVKIELAAGQFIKVDPGAARLLSVLSLQSLPRRLTLDFRDVFSDGFAFDSITGTAQVKQGVVRTENFKMRGVNGLVLMDGSADIVHETQNLHVAVIPEVNAGAASVVYGLAVNPVIGLGTFLAQLFLRDPLARALTYEFQVTGSWQDPAVNKIEHRAASAPAK